jgi:hypothetical protein
MLGKKALGTFIAYQERRETVLMSKDKPVRLTGYHVKRAVSRRQTAVRQRNETRRVIWHWNG